MCEIYYRWEVYGQEVDVSNRRYDILDRGQSLVISNAKVKDANTYTCVVSNVVGRDTHDITLTVQGKYEPKYSHPAYYFNTI